MIRAKSGKNIMLWGAIPCTGGSSWQHVNEALFRKTQNYDALERLRGLREKFRVLWRNYTVLADMVVALHGTVVNEWPKGCTYWSDPDVIRYARRHDLVKYLFDGRRYGLRSPEGHFVKKP
eukprot:12907758-Prorocentrum_lima.AAC.1